MGTNTNATGDGVTRPFNLDQLSEILMDRKRIPFGFFLSQALWDAIAARYQHETGDQLAPALQTFNGIRTALDKSLPATEFDVAFTEEAWRKRLSEIATQ